MKRNLFLTTLFLLLLTSAEISAQEKTPDFSGSWELDVSKSKLDGRARIESIKMNVAQTDKEIKIETTTKRTVNNDGGGMNRGGMFGDGTQTSIYSLVEGKFTRAQVMEMGKGSKTIDYKAKIDGNELTLESAASNGETTVTTKEVWSLSEDGKTLTVNREMQTPRGTQNSELVFTKLQSFETSVPLNSVPTNSSQTTGAPRTITGGVVNGKARNLVTPVYPNGARAARASGQVAVAVTIDEEGNVINANAVSGHTLLRAAAEDAARASKFNPTLLEGVPVKVTGTIIYNFVP